jgi:hypothetical protein
MATYDLTYGNLAGLQMQGGAMIGVNVFEIDWAVAKAACASWANGDIITIGKLPIGALVLPCAAETTVASQAGASNVSFQDDTGTPVVFMTGHDVATLGAKTPAAAGAALYFGGGTASGLHPVIQAAEKKVNVVLGATPPNSGKTRISFPIALISGLGA